MKGKRIAFILIEILIIVLGLVGATLAVNRIINDRSLVGIKAGEFYVDYKGNQNIEINSLEPISDDLININTKDNVIRVDFSIRGMKSNLDNDIIYDVIMDQMNIDCSFLNEYTKWNLYKNGNLLSSGNMSPSFDGNVKSQYFNLTNTQEDLPKYNDSYDNYTFILWISESCNDINSCNYVDQSDVLNSKISFRVFVALYTGNKVENVRKPNYDSSCANGPELYNNMIPVYYKDNEVVRADDKNSDIDNLWYDYNNKRWANAVVVKNNNYSIGEIIPESDILAYYVWIPKYSYKAWNINKELGYEAYDAYLNGIDIKFDNGNIICNDGDCILKDLDYYTHPAFDNVRGIWISKYELSIIDGVKFVPNKQVYTNTNVNYFEKQFDNIILDYGFGEYIDSHVINNSEWGAILYFTHSKYGNMDISFNDSYISGNNSLDSTTGNVYGIFDIVGGASEFVKATSDLGSATSEIKLNESIVWNNNYYEDNTYNNYYIRGGLSSGMYSYGGFNEGSPMISSRNVLKKKSSN